MQRSTNQEALIKDDGNDGQAGRKMEDLQQTEYAYGGLIMNTLGVFKDFRKSTQSEQKGSQWKLTDQNKPDVT